jgi:hypothetical protein
MTKKDREKGKTGSEMRSVEDIDKNFIPIRAEDIEVRFFKKDERGDFFLVRNPRDKRYVKLNEAGKEFLEAIDGIKTMEELQETTEIDVYNFVTILGKGGFLSNVQVKKKEEPFYTFKIPIFRSNHGIFIKMYRFFSFVSSTPFKIFYGIFVGASVIFFVLHFSEILEYVALNFDLTVPMTPILLLFAVFYVVELAHEFAHTGASYNHGAEPGAVGIVFHFLVGFFYVETPDTRVLSTRGSIDTFIAGPLTSMFAAAICTYMFVFTDHYPIVWGPAAFFWYMSTAITLSPFMQTDGYYIIQEVLKFPNLFSHSISYLRLNIFRFFRRVSKEDYQKSLEGYTKRELKIMKCLAAFIPVQIGILVYIFFFMAMHIQMFYVLQLAPVILSESNPYGFKSYFLFFMYAGGLILGAFAGSVTVYRFFKKKPTERW